MHHHGSSTQCKSCNGIGTVLDGIPGLDDLWSIRKVPCLPCEGTGRITAPQVRTETLRSAA